MNPKLPSIRDLDLGGKNVLVRADLEWERINCPREMATKEMVCYLQKSGALKIKVIGHKGNWKAEGIEVINDIRSDPREEKNEESLAVELAEGFDVYINEAFATSHRAHCSVDALPRMMKANGKQVAIGMRFEKEIEVLSGVFNKGGKKILIIGGAKAGDKEQASIDLAPKFDLVLKGGLLTGVSLRSDGLDISDEAIEDYKNKIIDAGLVVVAGPMGKFEDFAAEKGTREVFTAAADSGAYKIAGGGDTETALNKFGLTQKFDWISVGGGAMLVFLSTGTLPGIEALL